MGEASLAKDPSVLEHSSNVGDDTEDQRRLGIGQRAISFFKRKVGDGGEREIPEQKQGPLPYQPRIKSPARQDVVSEKRDFPVFNRNSMKLSSKTLESPSAASPGTTPSRSADLASIPSTVVPDVEPPATLRPHTITSSAELAEATSSEPPPSTDSCEQRHHFRPYIFSQRSQLSNAPRHDSMNLSRAFTKGHGVHPSIATIFAGACFTVAPSYHERALPDLLTPKVPSSVLEGPASPMDPREAEILSPPRRQRPAIKMKIITWNMGGASLPKGDLEVLLGRVGAYVPPDQGWDIDQVASEDLYTGGPMATETRSKGESGQEDTPRHDRIPPLPHDDGHPYHLLVIAGQECPWGDGKRIATGIGVAGELGDLARSRSKASNLNKSRDKDNEEILSSISQTPAADFSLDTSAIGSSTAANVSTEFPFGSPSTTTNGAVTGTPAHNKVFGGKGWSDMCEDWLCKGQAAQTQTTKGLAATAQAVISGLIDGQPDSLVASSPNTESREPTPTAKTQEVDAPSSPLQSTLLPNRRSTAAPSIALPSLASHDRSPRNSILGEVRASFPLRQTNDPHARDFAKSPSKTERPGLAGSTPAPGILAPPPKAKKSLQISIPGQAQQDSNATSHTLGAYELLVKERCAMIYMAVYCWRGCRDRVRGFDKGHVKSGLLAGRVGNKGAVGISVKLGQTRLLFVNSHLAAHEGRIQTRLENVAKIKRELRLDTFLPKDSSLHQTDDVTAMFDHAFWFGDLNFRVDITRKHADWLIMNEKYDQALEFDQLRTVMREGREFHKFCEHPIFFPPTYKFDVGKTLKKSKREKSVRRILQRCGHTATATIAPDTTADDLEDADESIVMRTETSTDERMHKDPSVARHLDDYDSDDGDGDGDDDDEDSSLSSVAWDSHGSSDWTVPTTDSEEDLSDVSAIPSSSFDPVVANNTTAASRPQIFSHGAAIKAKWRIMGFVRAATGASRNSEVFSHAGSNNSMKRRSKDSASLSSSVTSPTFHGSVAKSSRKSNSQQPRDRSAVTRLPVLAEPLPEMECSFSGRLSTKAAASAPSLGLKADGVASAPLVRRQGSQVSMGSVMESMVGDGAPSLCASRQKSSQLARRRPSSGKPRRRRSSAGDIEQSPRRRELGSAVIPTEQETEKQLYDTSAKQRVPSWTDRILWRTNFQPALAPLPSPVVEQDGLSGRLGKSIANARRAASAARHAQLNAFSLPHSHSVTLPPRYQTVSQLRTMPNQPRLRRDSHLATPPLAISRSNSPLNTSAEEECRSAEQVSSRASMPSTPSALRNPLKRTFSANHASSIDRRNVNRGEVLPRLTSMRITSQPPVPSSKTSSRDIGSAIDWLSQSAIRKTSTLRPRTGEGHSWSSGVTGSRRLSSWWSAHLPAFLTAQSAAAAFASLTSASKNREGSLSRPPSLEIVGPRRGEVECVLYKSLDDREMRALEGRSDHRPVIWVGLVGI